MRVAAKQTTQSVGIGAPILGLVATGVFQGGAETGAGAGEKTGTDTAIWLYNMIAGEYGCRVRPGSREKVTGVPSFENINGGQIRTVMAYNSVVAGGALDKLFACTSAGIFDVTAGGAGPWVAILPWPNLGGNAGWCSFTNYTNVNGDHFLLVCDEDNGYYVFNGTIWSVGTFSGTPKPLAVNLVHVTEWNARIWFVEKNSARAWFLDPLAIGGDITPLDVGSRFKLGGHLVQNTTWTVDAGDGMDDKFVQISAAGDVLIWTGVNPKTAADMVLVGRWLVGSVPEGRRVMSDWGGDVMILSASGVIAVSTLLEGRSNLGGDAYVSRNVNQYVRSEMQNSLDEFGWSMLQVPLQGITIMSVPLIAAQSSRAPIQFVMENATSAWSMFRDLDMVCQTTEGSNYLFGTNDGRIMWLTGTVDNVALGGTEGDAIVFSLLTHYSGMDNPGRWKRPQFIRPYWIGAAPPAYLTRFRFDFDITELLQNPAYVNVDASLWDSSIWDASVWAGNAQAYLKTAGAKGMGRHAAVAIRGSSTNELTYIGADIMFDVGGLL